MEEKPRRGAEEREEGGDEVGSEGPRRRGAEARTGGLERGGVGEACVCGLILEYVNVDDRLYVPVGD